MSDDKLTRLQLRLKELRYEESVCRSSMIQMKEEIANLRSIIADIVDKGQGVLPGIETDQGDHHANPPI